jgi:uroporphyrinogen-III synthase
MSKESKGLAGLRVLSLESRRAVEMAKLIANYGGKPIVAPSMREVPLESNKEAIAFARGLARGDFDVILFLTGVGARALAKVAETQYPREQFIDKLRKVTIVARGPKPLAVLNEFSVPVAITAPEPNTWRDLLQALDSSNISLGGKRLAVQEYGEANAELISGLIERGAKVTQVPVYKWELPEDTAPLRHAAQALVDGAIDLALFTTSVQIVHLLKVAKDMQLGVRESLAKIIVGSIGPVTSEELREQNVHVDFEPEHPKMGFLVNEAAKRMSARNSGAKSRE